MALREGGDNGVPQFEDPSVACLQLSVLHLALAAPCCVMFPEKSAPIETAFFVPVFSGAADRRNGFSDTDPMFQNRVAKPQFCFKGFGNDPKAGSTRACDRP